MREDFKMTERSGVVTPETDQVIQRQQVLVALYVLLHESGVHA